MRHILHFKIGRIWVLTALFVAAIAMLHPGAALAAGKVGNGTPASCTETALNTALSGGGKITFNCGPTSKTIILTSTKTIALDTTLDGGSKIVLSAPGHTHFLVNSSVTFTLKNLTLKNGSGTNGGALTNFGNANIDNVKFTKNAASSDGGAISNHGSLFIGESQFKSNTAGHAGGALFNDGGTAQIGLVKFTKNQSNTLGGAVANNAGSIAMFFGSFTGNQSFDGGAVYNTGTGSNQDFNSILVDFTGNHANYGGAVENWGEMDLAGSTMTNNSAVNDGGAVWSVGGSLEITASSIDENTSGTTGGGVSIYSSSTGDIEQVSFTNNHTDGTGGGLYTEAQTDMFNNTFSGNSGNGNGGGIYSTLGDLTSYNNTIGDNTAPSGAGIFYSGGSLDLENTVLTNNHGGNCGGSVPSSGANVSSDGTCTSFAKTGDMQNANPFLSPPAKNGGLGLTYLPQSASPLVDAGTTLSDIDEDERGISRPQDGSPDIGAIELCGFRPTAPTLDFPSNGGTEASGVIEYEWQPGDCTAFSQLIVRSGSKKGPIVVQENYVAVPLLLETNPLAPGTYYYQVKGCNEKGCTASPWWNFKVTQKGSPLDDPAFRANLLKLSKQVSHK